MIGPNHPAGVARAVALATEHGWDTRVTYAAGPPRNVALRLHRDGVRAFAWWTLDEGCRYKGGATYGLRSFRTLAALLGGLAVPRG